MTTPAEVMTEARSDVGFTKSDRLSVVVFCALFDDTPSFFNLGRHLTLNEGKCINGMHTL